MTSVRASLSSLLTLLGRAGIAGVVLLIACFAFLHSALRPLEARYGALQEQLDMNSDLSLLAVSTPATRLDAFYTFFEREGEVTDYLAQLYSIADQTGVALRTADYRMSESADLQLTQYSIALPLIANYAEIRAFLENALEQIPVLTLDRVSFRRKKVGDTLVEADVKLTLFVSRP